MTETQIFQGFIEHVFGVIFIDRVVSQVHVQIVDVSGVDFLVDFGGETDQPLVENIDAKRVTARNKGVDPHVEFEAFVEEGPIEVLLNNALAIGFEFSNIST